MNSNQLTVVTVENIPANEEAKVPTISVIPDENIELQKVYYNVINFMLQFNKEEGVDSMQEQVNIDPDPDEEEMQDMIPNDKIERHWRMVIE